MTVKNITISNLNRAVVASGFPHSKKVQPDSTREPNNNDWIRAVKLAKLGGGHDNFLKGIGVDFDLTFSQSAWQQFQRYNFNDMVSSQSKMHCLLKLPLRDMLNEYVDEEVISRLSVLIRCHNGWDKTPNCDIISGCKTKEDLWLKILYSTPIGLELTCAIRSNAMQIKTMIAQRQNHRLPEWKDFCKTMLEEIPFMEEIFHGQS